MARVEQHLVNREDKFEELENRLMELGDGIDETREELQATLNESLDKVANESEALRIAHAEEVSTMKEENRLLKEEVEKMHENMKDVRDELVLLKILVAQGVGTNPHPTLTIPTARVEIPKPSTFKGARSAREKNFHSPKEDRRGERPVLKCYLCDGPHKKRNCAKRTVLSAMDKEPKQASPPPEQATMGSLQYCSLGTMRLVGPSDAPSEDGEQDNGMGDVAKEKDAEECATQEESELPRELPLEEQD
ncbi:hypothetical protein GH714_013303 [Hevea brasiliensis]|uniref:Uncharacterized protein n=1 Tax=Hevea brasiliensis TaxID=3981 RepID=A0A6A6KFK4_HEVBR|nr:hypothetical protein GH714_013303 [Hevea brasiliensis]